MGIQGVMGGDGKIVKRIIYYIVYNAPYFYGATRYLYISVYNYPLP